MENIWRDRWRCVLEIEALSVEFPGEDSLIKGVNGNEREQFETLYLV